MNSDLVKAIEMLREGNYTCVICLGDVTHCSRRRGVAPLLELLENGTELKGFQAADRVVGKAAAMLYVLLGVAGVHAGVISESAKAVFDKAGIPCFYDKCVPAIFNRTMTGFCPMETAVKDINDPALAPAAVKAKLKELAANPQ